MARCTNLTLPRASILAIATMTAALGNAVITAFFLQRQDLSGPGWKGFLFRAIHGAGWGALLGYTTGLAPGKLALGSALGVNAGYYASRASQRFVTSDPQDIVGTTRKRILAGAGAGALATSAVGALVATYGRQKQCLPAK